MCIQFNLLLFKTITLVVCITTLHLPLLLFVVNQEGVLQKFRKSFSLRFYKRGSKESGSSDLGETLSEILGEPAEDGGSIHSVPSASASITQLDAKEEESIEHKHR